MRIGFGWVGHDEAALQIEKCERIHLVSPGTSLPDEFMDYLRPGDILVITSLDRLHVRLCRLVSAISSIQSTGVSLSIQGTAEAPAAPSSDTLVAGWCFLADFAGRHGKTDASRPKKSPHRSRGRPPALTNEQRAIAEKLLQQDGLSVEDAARQLGVSRATLYRYYPKRNAKRLDR